jgi:hypothetical protein
LLVHGLLHLLGFDHERSGREAGEMAKWENRLLGLSGKALKEGRGLVTRVGARAARAGPKKTGKKAAGKAVKKAVPGRSATAKRTRRPARLRQESAGRSK